jgi:hypothetical protein
MGIIAHHALVITGTHGDWIERAHEKARSLFADQVSPISPPMVNSTKSFCVFPDGSKEGWEESAAGDSARDALIAWLYEQEYEDHSSPLSWVEVHYGEIRYEGSGARITRSAWKDRG